MHGKGLPSDVPPTLRKRSAALSNFQATEPSWPVSTLYSSLTTRVLCGVAATPGARFSLA